MNPFDDDEEFDLIVDQIVTNTIQATQLIIQYIENGEAEPSNPRPRGPNKDRGREDGHDKLVADYFSDNPVYNDEDRFKRREGVFSASKVYVRYPTIGVRDFFRFYGRVPKDGRNDLKGMPKKYLSSLGVHSSFKLGFLVKFGAFGFTSHKGPTVILEAVASYDEWIWHAFFGVPGATNDIIVVNQSPIFNDLFKNKAPDSSFVANGTHYHHGYYLADGIYPEWTTFVKAFRYPTEVPRLQFTTRQESARKDIERTFATLKSKWHVVARPARVWSRRKLQEIMYTCIILHNMIREDEGFSHYPFDPTAVLPSEVETTISEEERANNVNFVKNRERHANLRADLSQHLWDSMPHN
ncbi:hypothetical protein OSB04_023260 [Centaurea solstitialis]|uniref:Transposase n=1 Tax=Centaurea solstitialis TaxID=347529 RepID=A0AA38SJI7_9ASTR|nr:hypothetical protein OSB04_023260 [Centaurea solstitialis]